MPHWRFLAGGARAGQVLGAGCQAVMAAGAWARGYSTRIGARAAVFGRVMALRRGRDVDRREGRVLARIRDLPSGWRRGAGLGRVPACQSRKICSRRLKMRARMAAIRVCRALDAILRSAPEGAVPALRRLAI